MPEKVLFVTAGAGVNPAMSILRTVMPDIRTESFQATDLPGSVDPADLGVGFLLCKKGGRRASAKKRAKAAGQSALVANLMRNVWACAVIFCGHFPDDVEPFTKRTLDEESRGDWYLRQMLGPANFHGGKALTLMSGNLNHQIVHHLFPDRPSNQLDRIAKEVQAIAEEYGLLYNTGSFPKQFLQVQKTLLKLSLPNSMLRAKASNAPEVRSDAAFTDNPEIAAQTGHRQLRKGLALRKKARAEILALAEGRRGGHRGTPQWIAVWLTTIPPGPTCQFTSTPALIPAAWRTGPSITCRTVLRTATVVDGPEVVTSASPAEPAVAPTGTADSTRAMVGSTYTWPDRG